MASHRFLLAMLALCLAALPLRLWTLHEFRTTNPQAHAPMGDGWLYWDLAAWIANGRGLPEGPFLNAPLYPLLLGALRWCGGELSAVYLWQIALNLATAGLLGAVVRRRFGDAPGAAACAAFLLLYDPALATTRVLADTLQVFLVVVTWWALVRASERPTILRAALAGVVIGLLTLACAPFIVLVVAVPLWYLVYWRREWPRASVHACGMALWAAAMIAPVTLHNWRTTGEFIPITAHSGITFRQGNAPGADGVYVALPGISLSRDTMHWDAQRAYEQTHGRAGSWGEINAYFRRQGVDYWREDWTRALRLWLRKAWWFLSGRNYHDILSPALEARSGYGGAPRGAPLPAPWLIFAALPGLASLARRPLRSGPEWMLLLVPLLTVIAFWYSPRYRAPALPVLVGVAAWVAVRAFRRDERPAWRAAAACAMIAGLASGWVNRAAGFDRPDTNRGLFAYNVGISLLRTEQVDAAIEQFRQSLDADPSDAAAWQSLGSALGRSGRSAEALEPLRRAIELEPQLAEAWSSLGNALGRLGRPHEALAYHQRAVALRPDSVENRLNLAVTLSMLGRDEEADKEIERARALTNAPGNFALFSWYDSRRRNRTQPERETNPPAPGNTPPQ